MTETGESATSNAFNGVLPMGFALLLMVSVMSSGQYLLTTTIEEKSSRTMEVILSAVSPLELLTGKILGQMAVGLTILVTYSSIGILGLVSMAMFGLLDMSLVVYLFIFFLITYVVMGSLMAAIGSSVNELREAQSLMTPITLMMTLPWLFWYPISRDPNSVFATALSFIPPMNAFAMLLRMTSTAPPPVWQVWLSIAVGVAAAAGALWFASRVFKIGLLMHGRPPNFATLVRWAQARPELRMSSPQRRRDAGPQEGGRVQFFQIDPGKLHPTPFLPLDLQNVRSIIAGDKWTFRSCRPPSD